MADNNVLKGMWCFNNTITFDASTDFDVNFICNIQNEKTQCTGIALSPSGTWLIYLMEDNSYIAHDGSRWSTESTKTIVITDETEQTTGLLAWLQANATKVDDSFYTELESVNDYLYNISRLQSNMQELIIAEGGTVKYKSLEQYMQSLIDLRKKFVELLASFGVEASESEKMSPAWADKFTSIPNNIVAGFPLGKFDWIDNYTNKISDDNIKKSVTHYGGINFNNLTFNNLTTAHIYAFNYLRCDNLVINKLDNFYVSSGGMAGFDNAYIINLTMNDYIGLGYVTGHNKYTASFSKTANVQNIILPKALYLEYNMFSGNKNLKTIEAPELINIGPYCFSNCTGLTTINAPKVKILRTESFYGCSKLIEVYTPEYIAFSVEEHSVFSGCSLLEKVTISNETKTLCSNMFYNCKKLTEVIGIENVEELRGTTFQHCSALTKINLPKCTMLTSTSANGYGSFKDCTSLVEITLGDVITLGKDCFRNCTNLATINANLLIETVDAYCFESCSKITNLKLPNVKTIYTRGFGYCTSLTDLYLGFDGMITLDNSTCFAYAASGINIHVKPDYADSYATATNWSSLISAGKIIIVGDYSD